MQDIKIGQTVHNSRTGDSGKVTGFVTRWNGRHEVKKIEVLSQDTSTKVWAFSSCKVIEEAAPRALVLLKELLQRSKEHLEIIKNAAQANYESENVEALEEGVLQYILEDDCVSGSLNSITEFQSLSRSMFNRVIEFIIFEFSNGRIDTNFAGGMKNFITELFNLFYGKKPN